MTPPALKILGLLAVCLCAAPAAAEEGMSKILAPANGAKLEANHAYPLQYEVKSVEKADHVHLYVDGDESGMTHHLTGKFTLGPLAPGERKVCIRVVNKNHTPIAGSETCIAVSVQ